MGTRSSQVTSQLINDEYAGRSLGYVYNPSTLAYEVAQPAGSSGGGGAATIADGADVAEGAKADAAWDGLAASATLISIGKYSGLKLEAIRALLAGTVAISAVALPLPAGASTGAKQDTGNTSLASVDGKTPALVGGRVPVDASGVAVPVTDNAGSLTVDAPVGTPLFARLSDGAAALVGQKVMASSLPVAIASDQSAVPTNPSDNVARLLGKIQERENGYANVSLYAEAVAGIIAETAISINKSTNYGAAAAATSNGPTAGKELVICGIIIGWVATTTTANTCRFRIRVNPGGAAIVTSPIAFTMRIGWESATFIANEEELQPIFFDKPIIVPNGGQFMATLACVAANGSLDVQIIAYERTP